MIQQVAEETYQGAAATESARNHIAGQAGYFKRMATAFMALARKSGVTPEDLQALEREEQQRLEDKSEKGDANDHGKPG